jgi:hypothetical protein
MAGGSLTVQLLNYTAEGRPFMNSMCVMPLRQPAQPGGGPAALDASFARPWHYVGVCKALPLDLAAASRAIALVADKTAVGGGGGGASAIGCGGAHGAHGGGGALGGLTLDEMGAGTHRASAYGERPVPAGTAAAVGGAIKPRVAPFISKLFKMVSAPETDDCIRWSADRASFMIADTGRFEQEVLPAYFRHNRFASFSQQLHTYTFAQQVRPARRARRGARWPSGSASGWLAARAGALLCGRGAGWGGRAALRTRSRTSTDQRVRLFGGLAGRLADSWKDRAARTHPPDAHADLALLAPTLACLICTRSYVRAFATVRVRSRR